MQHHLIFPSRTDILDARMTSFHDFSCHADVWLDHCNPGTHVQSYCCLQDDIVIVASTISMLYSVLGKRSSDSFKVSMQNGSTFKLLNFNSNFQVEQSYVQFANHILKMVHDVICYTFSCILCPNCDFVI